MDPHRDVGQLDLAAAVRVRLVQRDVAADVNQPGHGPEPVAQRDQLGHLRGVLGQHQLGARVLDDVLALLGRALGIDRHRHRAGEQDRDVAQHPLEARLRQDADPIADGDPLRDQARGDLARRLVRLGPGQAHPDAVLAVFERHVVGRFLHPVGPHGDRCARFVFAERCEVAGGGHTGHETNSIKFLLCPRSLCRGDGWPCARCRSACASPSTGCGSGSAGSTCW